MCGIFCYLYMLQKHIPQDLLTREHNQKLQLLIKQHERNGKYRGPDSSSHKLIKNNKCGLFMGFHRLAINGLDQISDQPITITLPLKHTDNSMVSGNTDDETTSSNNVTYTLVCNGEIYNYKELSEMFGFDYKTNSDCESIIHMIHNLYTIEQQELSTIISLLDGVFAFTLHIDNDIHNNGNPSILISRDRFGVRPLYEFIDEQSNYGVSSVLSNCTDIENSSNIKTNEVKQFPPGNYTHIYLGNDGEIKEHNVVEYYNINSIKHNPSINFSDSLKLVKQTFIQSVKKRVLTTERPIACLLSGGLDSSLVTSIVTKLLREIHGCTYKPETYSIGLKGSVDLQYARKVATYLDTNHHEIIVTEEEFLNAIPEVINHIESYDTTTVRASVGNYLVSKYIAENSPSQAKVIFNGDGSDELTGGYMYFYAAPNDFTFDMECKRLLSDIYYYDVLRSDRSISSNGLEARTPFLDHLFVQTYLSLPIEFRRPNKSMCEKYLLRKAFDDKHTLPDSVLWRTKEAFSDGVSSNTRSWYEIIRDDLPKTEHFKSHSNTIDICEHYNTSIVPQTLEQKYYKMIFMRRYFDTCESIIPYYWMPRFIEASDSSARTLNIYNKINNKDNEKNIKTNMDVDNELS